MPDEDDTVWYVSRWSPIEREGEVVAALVVASDITRRVMLERLDLDVEQDSDSSTRPPRGSSGSTTRQRHVRQRRRGRPARRPHRRNQGTQHPRGGPRRRGGAPRAQGRASAPCCCRSRTGSSSTWRTTSSGAATARASRSQYTSSPIVERGELTGAVLTFNDVTERKRFEAQLQYLADHDPVTGLFNRRRFEQELARHLSYDARYGTGGAVLALDLDNFKYVNDTLGHKAGDEVITRVARNIRERIRETDTLRAPGRRRVRGAPAGGRDRAGAVRRAHDRRRGPRRTRSPSAGQQIQVTASIGVTTFGNREVDGEALLVEADLAMYDAKAAGRDQVRALHADGRARGPDRVAARVGRPGAPRTRRGAVHALLRSPSSRSRPASRSSTSSCCGWSATTASSILPGSFLPERRAVRPDAGGRPLGAPPGGAAAGATPTRRCGSR